MGIAIRIDISTELEAIRTGQCGGCRTGFIHTKSDLCDKHTENYVKMGYCTDCNNKYSLYHFDECPVCRNKN